MQSKYVGHDLSKYRAMTLSLRRRRDLYCDRPDRVEADGRGCLRPVFWASLPTLRRCKDGRDITHIGDAGLHDGGVADTIKTTFRAGSIAPPFQIGEVAVFGAKIKRAIIVAGIIDSTCRGMIRKGRGWDQIAAYHVKRIKVEFSRNALHESL